jgi:hypothetical protein
MKSNSITYDCALNNGSVLLFTLDKEYFELSVAGYQGEKELGHLTKDELFELGEWFIAMAKDKE